MPLYHPVDMALVDVPEPCDLIAIYWDANRIEADFALPLSDSDCLRVTFHAPCIVRMLDDMPLGAEGDNGPGEGLVTGGFAYRVDGARFETEQSAIWRETHSASHFRFVTGWGCLDVLSGAQPHFAVVKRHLATQAAHPMSAPGRKRLLAPAPKPDIRTSDEGG